MKELSILIPTFNDPCTTLVKSLQQQAQGLDINYEIIVADDASTDKRIIAQNRAINQLPHCKMIECQQNRGRAEIRNFLAKEAHYEWLLFIDSDMIMCRQDFIEKYVNTEGYDVVDGGVTIGNPQVGNLRGRYEKTAAKAHTVEQREQAPYHDFHTANFLVNRKVILQYPFDKRFKYYGYEDVMFGKCLKQHNIPILHIDNPISFEIFETNGDFIYKTEEGLRTLFYFKEELRGYSRLIAISDKLPHWPFRIWHRLFGDIERKHLVGKHPSLFIFNMYRLGYFLSLG